MRYFLLILSAPCALVVGVAACIETPAFETESGLAAGDIPLAREDDGIDNAVALASDAMSSPSRGADGSARDASDEKQTPPGSEKLGCGKKPASVCCGEVTCVGCSSAKDGSCKKCEKECGAGQLCCARGGLRCLALSAA